MSRGDTLIEFKGCAISALSGNTLKVTSGEPNELLSSLEYDITNKGDGVYAFNKKKSCIDKEQMNKLNYLQYNKISPTKYGDLNQEEVSDYLCVKPLLNGNRKKLITADKRKVPEVKRIKESRVNSSHSIRHRMEEINRIKVQGCFVNKLYE